MNFLNKIINKFSPLNKFGLVIDWEFHRKNKWVSALTPYLIEAIIKEFRPVIISSQEDYNSQKQKLKYIVSAEPGWAAPKIQYDTQIKCKKAVFYSDPHSRTKEKSNYFYNNNFDFAFSYYKNPFFYHFKDFPKEKFVHMPWAIPDQFIDNGETKVRNNEVIIFGGKSSDAYDVRNWCREQEGIKNYEFSGVENKKMSDKEYFKWLANFDAIVAAGSSDLKYDLVTPKYFEIASSGALLIGQDCTDLSDLGLNDQNMVIFTKNNFNKKVEGYKKDPAKFISIRVAGRELIRQRHKISDRIKKIKAIFHLNGQD